MARVSINGLLLRPEKSFGGARKRKFGRKEAGAAAGVTGEPQRERAMIDLPRWATNKARDALCPPRGVIGLVNQPATGEIYRGKKYPRLSAKEAVASESVNQPQPPFVPRPTAPIPLADKGRDSWWILDKAA